MTEKTVNYTAEQTVEIVAAYQANPTAETVANLAVKFGRSIASIRAKLVREKVYIAAVYVSKSGNTPESKESMADSIGAFFPGMDENSISSLAKANKKILKAIATALKEAAEFKAKAMEPFETEVIEPEPFETEE